MTRVRSLCVGCGAVSWLFLLVAGDPLSAVSWPLPGVWGLASAFSWAGFEAVAVQAFVLAAPTGVQHGLGLLPEGLLDQ